MPKEVLLRVEWVDSKGGGGWELVHKTKVPDEALEIISVGFLVSETKLSLTMCGTMEKQGGQYLDAVTIPKRAILKRRRFILGEANGRHKTHPPRRGQAKAKARSK